MNQLVASLTAWIKSKSITSHTVFAALFTVATIYTTDQQFRDFVLLQFKAHPVFLADLTFVVGMILKYSHSSSPAGAVVAAEKVMDSPAAPTIADINAVKGVTTNVPTSSK